MVEKEATARYGKYLLNELVTVHGISQNVTVGFASGVEAVAAGQITGQRRLISVVYCR